MNLIAELRRRKVFKIGAAYVVVAWLVVQVASIAFPAFDAPSWVLRVFILIAFLGLPIALVFAWAFDFQPDGLQSEARSRSDKLIFLIAAAAEANRTPFDLTEADSEIVAGFATEYSGMRFGMFISSVVGAPPPV